jgi:N6-L-threonylcarbamoyladenine synthase
VAANTALRERIAGLSGVEVHVPERALCTDNAAMIAGAARFSPVLAHPEYLALDAYPS